VNRLRSYLDTHKGFTGVGVYALTTGPKAIGNYMADRVMAVCFLAAAAILNIGLAWVIGLKRPTSGFFQRLVGSVAITVCGTIPVFIIVVARAIVWHSFDH
jgi:hypothetical protein